MRTLLSRALLTSMVFGVTAQAQQKNTCSDCVAKLLIVVDERSTIRVDGETLGALAAGDSKLVRVGLGAHLIEARANDVTWSTTMRIDKPGQEIVKTDIVRARDQARAMTFAAKWAGEWVGSTSYNKEDGSTFNAYYEQFTFRVSKSGSCTASHDTNFYLDYQRDGESAYDLRRRVIAGARNRNATSSSYSCEITPEGGMHSPFGDVSPNGEFTFVQTWVNKERVTVRLTDPNSAR